MGVGRDTTQKVRLKGGRSIRVTTIRKNEGVGIRKHVYGRRLILDEMSRLRSKRTCRLGKVPS